MLKARDVSFKHCIWLILDNQGLLGAYGYRCKISALPDATVRATDSMVVG
jgi:hypothetical protein